MDAEINGIAQAIQDGSVRGGLCAGAFGVGPAEGSFDRFVDRWSDGRWKISENLAALGAAVGAAAEAYQAVEDAISKGASPGPSGSRGSK